MQCTPDGLHLVTAGTDSQIRLWDAASGMNTLVSYGGLSNGRAQGARQMCVAGSPRRVIHPSGHHLHCYDLTSGRQLALLRGHLDTVGACAYREESQELISGAADRQILWWAPRAEAGDPDPGSRPPRKRPRGEAMHGPLDDVDYWSSDDERELEALIGGDLRGQGRRRPAL